MNILFYAAGNEEVNSRFKQTIENIETLESVTDCWNYNELCKHFENMAPLPETVVLCARNQSDLESFITLRPRLEDVFFILVLPDDQDETIAKGHRLRPRFVAYRDEDFSHIEAVLRQLEKKQRQTEPIRHAL